MAQQIVKGNIDFGLAENTSGNVLQNTDLLYVSGPAAVSIWSTVETPGSVPMTFKLSTETIADGVDPNPQAAVGDINRQDDLVVDRVMIAPGVTRQLNLTFANATGGDLNANYLVQVDTP